MESRHLRCQSNRQYHYGLRSGDNASKFLWIRALLRTMHRTGRCDYGNFLGSYVAFMTTPDSHNDMYAESYYPDFFQQLSKGYLAGTLRRCRGSRHGVDRRFGLLPPDDRGRHRRQLV